MTARAVYQRTNLEKNTSMNKKRFTFSKNIFGCLSAFHEFETINTLGDDFEPIEIIAHCVKLIGSPCKG